MTVAGLEITKNVLPEWQLERSKASLAGHVDLSRLTKRDDLQSLTSPGGGGKVSPRKSVVQSACQYYVTFRVSNFENGEQSVHRRDR